LPQRGPDDAVGVAVAVGVPHGNPGSHSPTVGVAVAVGPAWATADQIVTASATMTRDPTTERWVVAFDMVLPLKSEA
jgi:hypothetical protein